MIKGHCEYGYLLKLTHGNPKMMSVYASRQSPSELQLMCKTDLTGEE